MLANKGHEVLNQLSIPKFGKIFIMLLKLDHIDEDAQGQPIQQWPSAITDLVSLANNEVHRKLFIRFIVKTLHIFEEEIVDRY